MKETIYRQDAIDAINHICPVDTEYDCTLLDRVDVRYVLSDLPTAQPEITDEQAIDHLQKSGWMQSHDKQMYEAGLKEQLADDGGSYDALLPSADSVSKKDVHEWLLAYYEESFDLMGRYYPHEVISWLINDFTKGFIAERRRNE